MTLAETICLIMKEHIEENNGIIMGETLTSIGNTYGTIPNNRNKNIIELPMTDVAASGFATGAALVGRPVVFVLRFQDFFLLNCSSLIQDAAISKEFHGYNCPIFIRAIASEKAGPNHSNVLHSIPMHFPGMKVSAPMTPAEYREVYEVFKKDKNPIYVSEDRYSLQKELVFDDQESDRCDIALFGIANARMEIENSANMLRELGYIVNVYHIFWLKPFNLKFYSQKMKKAKIGIVVDSGREICGASEHLAYELMKETGKRIYALGSDDMVKCLRPDEYHLSPKAKDIYLYAKSIMENMNYERG